MRNWDYRYGWVHDTTFSVYALRRIGLGQEADAFMAWVLDLVERDGYTGNCKLLGRRRRNRQELWTACP